MVLKLTILTIFFIGLKPGIALSMDGQVNHNKNELDNPNVAAYFIEERGNNQNFVKDTNFYIGYNRFWNKKSALIFIIYILPLRLRPIQ